LVVAIVAVVAAALPTPAVTTKEQKPKESFEKLKKPDLVEQLESSAKKSGCTNC
jgi:hypothetical protein